MTEHPGLSFNSDGTFKIMIITDIQDSVHVSPYMIELITKSLEREKPDLVIFGGDNICGFAPSLNFSSQNVKKSISTFLKPVTDRKIPFCVVFGNHDANRAMSKTEQLEYFLSFDNCFAQYGTISDRVGNYNLLLKDSHNEKDIFNLWFVDSGQYANGRVSDGYAWVTDEQISWYEEKAGELREQNEGNPVPSLLFQHIPVPEIYEVLSPVTKETAGAVRGHRTYKDKYYVMNRELVTEGTMEEAPCPPDINNGQFESWKKQGDILAAFFGHDHVNDFNGVYDGIHLIYTPGAGFYSYGKRGGHGVRIVELDENDLLHFKTRMVCFSDVSERNIPWYLERIGMQITSVTAGLFLILFVFFIIAYRKKLKHLRITRKR